MCCEIFPTKDSQTHINYDDVEPDENSQRFLWEKRIEGTAITSATMTTTAAIITNPTTYNIEWEKKTNKNHQMEKQFKHSQMLQKHNIFNTYSEICKCKYTHIWMS